MSAPVVKYPHQYMVRVTDGQKAALEAENAETDTGIAWIIRDAIRQRYEAQRKGGRNG